MLARTIIGKKPNKKKINKECRRNTLYIALHYILNPSSLYRGIYARIHNALGISIICADIILAVKVNTTMSSAKALFADNAPRLLSCRARIINHLSFDIAPCPAIRLGFILDLLHGFRRPFLPSSAQSPSVGVQINSCRNDRNSINTNSIICISLVNNNSIARNVCLSGMCTSILDEIFTSLIYSKYLGRT